MGFEPDFYLLLFYLLLTNAKRFRRIPIYLQSGENK